MLLTRGETQQVHLAKPRQLLDAGREKLTCIHHQDGLLWPCPLRYLIKREDSSKNAQHEAKSKDYSKIPFAPSSGRKFSFVHYVRLTPVLTFGAAAKPLVLCFKIKSWDLNGLRGSSWAIKAVRSMSDLQENCSASNPGAPVQTGDEKSAVVNITPPLGLQLGISSGGINLFTFFLLYFHFKCITWWPSSEMGLYNSWKVYT